MLGLSPSSVELAPQSLRRAPRERNFLSQGETGSYAIVRVGLSGCLLCRYLGQPLGGEEAPFDGKGVNVESGLARWHVQVSFVEMNSKIERRQQHEDADHVHGQ